jgi:hypothetical protein
MPIEYGVYSITPFEKRPGSWFAKIRRLDGKPIETAGFAEALEEITTSSGSGSAADAVEFAKQGIDGGGMN